jgi:hypothetical protein
MMPKKVLSKRSAKKSFSGPIWSDLKSPQSGSGVPPQSPQSKVLSVLSVDEYLPDPSPICDLPSPASAYPSIFHAPPQNRVPKGAIRRQKAPESAILASVVGFRVSKRSDSRLIICPFGPVGVSGAKNQSVCAIEYFAMAVHWRSVKYG